MPVDADVRATLPLALALMLPVALAQAQVPPHTDDASRLPESNAMPDDDASRVAVDGESATLDAGFDYDAAKQTIAVRYRLRNTGQAPIAVFDRGNRQSVLAKRQVLGEIAPPRFEETDGDTTLSHVATALPKPAPTVPPVPLAIQVAAGAEASGAFRFTLGSKAPKRLRWCLGIAPFDAGDFSEPAQAAGVEVWRASFAVVDRQQILCTPWFDLARGEFEKAR